MALRPDIRKSLFLKGHSRQTFIAVCVLVFAATIGLLVLTGGYLVLSEQSARQSAARMAGDLALSVEENVSRSLSSANLVLESMVDIATQEEPGSDDMALRMRARLRWSPFLRDLIIVNEDGTIIASSSRHNVLGMTIADISFFETLKEGRPGFMQIGPPAVGRDIRDAIASGRDDSDVPLPGRPWHFLLGRPIAGPTPDQTWYAIGIANPGQLLRLIDRASVSGGQQGEKSDEIRFIRVYRYDGTPLIGNREEDRKGFFPLAPEHADLFDNRLKARDWGTRTTSFWTLLQTHGPTTIWNTGWQEESPSDGMHSYAVESYRATVPWPILVSIEFPFQTVFTDWLTRSLWLIGAMMALLVLLAGLTGIVLRQLYLGEKNAEVLRLRDRALSSSSNGVVLVDARQEGWPVEYVNAAFTTITGLKPEEVLGQGARILRRGAAEDPALETIRRHLARSSDVSVIFRNYRNDEEKTPFWNDLKISPVQDEDGNVTHFLGIQNDVTDLIEARESLEKTVDKLARSNAELEQFAYISSHDLQEPLRMVSSYLDLLKRRTRDQLDENALEYLQYASDGARRMRELITDLLEYSRLGKEVEGQPVDSGQAMAEALEHLHMQIIESKASIELPDSMPMVMARHRSLVSVFQNLFGNAIKYARKDQPPLITLRWTQEEDMIRFSVRDHGIGIPEEHFERIFKIFQRLHDRDSYEGTGLGLSLCRRIIETHGGQIRVESVPEAGSVFSFTLPAIPEEPDLSGAPAGTETEPDLPPASPPA